MRNPPPTGVHKTGAETDWKRTAWCKLDPLEYINTVHAFFFSKKKMYVTTSGVNWPLPLTMDHQIQRSLALITDQITQMSDTRAPSTSNRFHLTRAPIKCIIPTKQRNISWCSVLNKCFNKNPKCARHKHVFTLILKNNVSNSQNSQPLCVATPRDPNQPMHFVIKSSGEWSHVCFKAFYLKRSRN